MDGLTDSQLGVLMFVQDAIRTGRPPSIGEIQDRFGWASTNSARAHLKALIRKGYLDRQPGARGLRVLGFPGLQFQNQNGVENGRPR